MRWPYFFRSCALSLAVLLALEPTFATPSAYTAARSGAPTSFQTEALSPLAAFWKGAFNFSAFEVMFPQWEAAYAGIPQRGIFNERTDSHSRDIRPPSIIPSPSKPDRSLGIAPIAKSPVASWAAFTRRMIFSKGGQILLSLMGGALIFMMFLHVPHKEKAEYVMPQITNKENQQQYVINQIDRLLAATTDAREKMGLMVMQQNVSIEDLGHRAAAAIVEKTNPQTGRPVYDPFSQHLAIKFVFNSQIFADTAGVEKAAADQCIQSYVEKELGSLLSIWKIENIFITRLDFFEGLMAPLRFLMDENDRLALNDPRLTDKLLADDTYRQNIEMLTSIFVLPESDGFVQQDKWNKKNLPAPELVALFKKYRSHPFGYYLENLLFYSNALASNSEHARWQAALLHMSGAFTANPQWNVIQNGHFGKITLYALALQIEALEKRTTMDREGVAQFLFNQDYYIFKKEMFPYLQDGRFLSNSKVPPLNKHVIGSGPVQRIPKVGVLGVPPLSERVTRRALFRRIRVAS